MQDDEDVEFARTLIDNSYDELYYSMWLQMKEHHESAYSCYFVITKFFILMIRKSSHKKKLKLEVKDQIIEIRNLEKTQSSLKLTFGHSAFRVSDTHMENLIEKLLERIYAISLEANFPTSSLSSINASDRIRMFSPQDRSIAVMYNQSSKVSPKTGEIFGHLEYFANTFNFTDYPSLTESIEPTLITLEGLPSYNHVIIPQIRAGTSWPQLTRVIIDNSQLTKLTTSDTINLEFISFCKELSKKEHNRLSDLNFVSVSFNSDQLAALSRLVKSKSIQSISFCSCEMPSGKVLSFFKEIATPQLLNALQISSMKIDCITQLIPSLLSIRSISLQNVGIQLNSLVNSISSSQIVSADFSMCLCTDLLQIHSPLPHSLTRLIINAVQWMPENLCAVIMLISTSTNPISLSLSNASLSTEGWEHFFALISSLDGSKISAFIWRNNPIQYQLCDFLLSAPDLTFVSFAGCKLPENQCVQQLIIKHSKIESLDIHGTSLTGKDLVNFAQQICSSASLKRVDFSHNLLGSKDLLKVFEVFALDERIQSLCLDENGMTDSKTLVKIMEHIKQGKREIYVPFPHHDASKILIAGGSSAKASVLSIQSQFKVEPPPAEPGKAIGYGEWQRIVDEKYEIIEKVPEIRKMVEEKVREEPKEVKEEEVHSDHKPDAISVSWEIDAVQIPSIQNAELMSDLRIKFAKDYLNKELFKQVPKNSKGRCSLK